MVLETLICAGTISLVVLYVLGILYFKLTTGICRSRRDLRGKTVIITGANTGIGIETAKDLASRNARVILACRSVSRGQTAAEDVIKSTGNTNVVFQKLDLSSLQSVREFAQNVLDNEERLDILVNNAGVVLEKRQVSEDGLEMTMATNHFGHFLLTNMLVPLLKKSAPSRIVVVSSLIQDWVSMPFDNLNAEKSYSPMQVYGASKLANIYFMRELSSRLHASGVTVNALHPGAVKTELSRDTKGFLIYAFFFLFGFFFKNAKDGAQTSIYVAVDEDLEGVSGKYFSDCREKKLKKHAMDRRAAERLWQISEEVTGWSDTQD